jgi:hypothetical protein
MGRLLLSILLVATAPSTQPATVDVGTQVLLLRHQPIPPSGRGTLVAEYEKLIDEAGADPKAVDAMMDLAALWGMRDDAHHISPNPAEELKWYRRAADAATTDNPLWASARFHIVWLIQSGDPDDARKLLADIAAQTVGDPVSQAQVESSLLTLSLHQQNLDEAEQHARKLFGWYDSPANIPVDSDGKDAVDAMIATAADSMIDAIASDTQSADDRVTRIRRLMDDYPYLQSLQDAGQSALNDIQKEKASG